MASRSDGLSLGASLAALNSTSSLCKVGAEPGVGRAAPFSTLLLARSVAKAPVASRAVAAASVVGPTTLGGLAGTGDALSALSGGVQVRSLHTPAGDGRGKSWVNPANVPKGEFLAKFCDDLTARAKDHKLDPVIGRENEIRRTIEVRRTSLPPLPFSLSQSVDPPDAALSWRVL